MIDGRAMSKAPKAAKTKQSRKSTSARARVATAAEARPHVSRKQLERMLLVDEALAALRAIPDHRIDRTKLHPIATIVGLVLIATVAGANSIVGVERFGEAKRAFLARYLDMRNGIPSHDTIAKVMGLVDRQALLNAIHAWVTSIRQIGSSHNHIAIDGKTIRGAVARGADASVSHLVRAFSADFGLVLGAVRTPEKSNEIRAIPELLEQLALEGTIVTIDAGGCYPAIAKKVVERGGDYLIALKGNQTHLHADTIALCTGPGCAQLEYEFAETRDTGHGREEVRRAWKFTAVDSLRRAHEFEGLAAVIRVESIRTIKGKTTTENRYYLTNRASLPALEALQFIRRHWAIENELHWVLDVAFREDQCRILAANVAEAFSHVRAATIPMLRAAPGPKVGAETRRMMAAWDDNVLAAVLEGRAIA